MKFLVLLALVGIAAAQIQVQIPIQRPQQPQFPQFPQQPPRQQFPPRANWRPGQPDPRCPIPDDHDGEAFFLPGPTANTFFICWGGLAFPFTCPQGTVWWNLNRTCALQAQIDAGRFRPFNEDGEQDE